MSGRRCLEQCKLDLHYSKLCFYHHDWKAFAYFPWFRFNVVFQSIYLAWRWGVFLYFFSWLITVGAKSDVSTFFTFLTIWSFLIYNFYLMVAALSVTTEFIRINFIKSDSRSDFSSHTYKLSRHSPRGCCGYTENNLSWYLSVHWFFFLLGNMFAVTIPLLYWPLLYRGTQLTAEEFHVHLINGIFAFADIILSGIPVHFFHVLYLMIFGCVYSLFSGLYFAGTQKIIYPVLDYGKSVGGAVGVSFGVIFVVIPLIYLLVFFAIYKIKMLILYRIWGTEIIEEYEGLPPEETSHNNYDTFSGEKNAPV